MGGKLAIPRDLLLSPEFLRKPEKLGVFLYLLASANFKDNSKLLRGQCYLSRANLALMTGMSPSHAERTVKWLETGQYIEVKPDSKSDRTGRIVTICNYDSYCRLFDETGQQTGQQTDSKRTANGQQTDTLEVKKERRKEEKKKREGGRKASFSPPSLEDVKQYVQEKGYHFDPEMFFAHYQANDWVQGSGQKIKDWKACATTWEKRERNGSQRQLPGVSRYAKPPTPVFRMTITDGSDKIPLPPFDPFKDSRKGQ